MARLRVRVELSRSGQGVPLHKMANVIDESLKFFQMLSEDVGLAPGSGEWLGIDFDRDALNFTSEFVGHVTSEQKDAFHAAFAGTTSLRRGTIAQFARITDAIGEEELVGFGLYQSDEDHEPTEWRCISRRDALRIIDEIDMLTGSGEEFDSGSHLPAVRDSALVSRLFSERHMRGSEQARWGDYVREMETSLSTRLANVENAVQRHSNLIEDLHNRTATTEESFRNLLTAVENFCNQAAHQIERIPQMSLPAASAPAPTPANDVLRNWPLVLAGIALGCAVGLVTISMWSGSSGTAQVQNVEARGTTTPGTVSTPVPTPAPTAVAASPAAPATPAPAVTAKAAPAPVAAPVARTSSGSQSESMQLELGATEPTWISLRDATGKQVLAQLLSPGETKTVDVATPAVIRAGNAAGLEVKIEGKPIGSIGPHGGVREVEFAGGSFRIRPM